MTQLLATLRKVAEALDGLGQRWALIGGLAVSARTEPRFTRDIDVAVAVADDAQAESLVLALTQRGFSILALLEQDAVGRLATVRLRPAGGRDASVVVDLLMASSGIEPELTAEADRFELADGLVVPVAKAGHLLALKILARDDDRRPQDAADVRALLQGMDAADLTRAEEAIAAIQARGYHRGRDLPGLLLAARRQFGRPESATP